MSQPGKRDLKRETVSCDKVGKSFSTSKKMEDKNGGLSKVTKEKISWLGKKQEKKTKERDEKQMLDRKN